MATNAGSVGMQNVKFGCLSWPFSALLYVNHSRMLCAPLRWPPGKSESRTSSTSILSRSDLRHQRRRQWCQRLRAVRGTADELPSTQGHAGAGHPTESCLGGNRHAAVPDTHPRSIAFTRAGAIKLTALAYIAQFLGIPRWEALKGRLTTWARREHSWPLANGAGDLVTCADCGLMLRGSQGDA